MSNINKVIVDGVTYDIGGSGGGGGGAVSSVNGKTGDVVLNASDVGAVQSVNNKTGAVVLSPADIGAKVTQTAKSSPSASGTAVAFIDAITQDAQGVITATKKSVREATTSQSGLITTTQLSLLYGASERALAAGDNFAPHADNASTYPIKAGAIFTRRFFGEQGEYLYRALTDISSSSELSDATCEQVKVSDLYDEIRADIFAAYPAMSAHGDDVTIAGTIAAPIRGLTIYGKSVQSSTPAPDAPVDIATVGGDGTLAISLTDGNDTGTHSMPTPNGLPGIKDASGNYIDASSQKWLCDTIDKAAGTHTQRVGVFKLDGEYTPTTIETVGSYTRFWYQVSATSMTPSTGTLCSHLPYDPSGYSQARSGFGIDASYPRNIWAKLPTSLVGSTAASIKAWMQSNPMTLVAAIAAPVTTDLTTEQAGVLESVTAFDGSTRVYTSGAVSPDLDVLAAVTVEAYVDYRLSSIS